MVLINSCLAKYLYQPQIQLDIKEKNTETWAYSRINVQFFKTHFLKLLSKQNPLLNTQLIKNDFEISLKHEDKSISILWFRIYTFLVFWEIYFV